MGFARILVPLLAALAAGCAEYRWKPSVPEAMRTVAVPVFVNESDVTELGAVVTRQVLREFMREGTYRVAAADEAAVEVQGSVRRGESRIVAYGRSTGARAREHRLDVTAEVSFIDRKSGRVLVDNRRYRATTTFLAASDVLTAERDASGRVAEELARQIVDDALTLEF